MNECSNEWMDDGWMGIFMNELVAIWMSRFINGWMGRLMNEWMDE